MVENALHHYLRSVECMRTGTTAAAQVHATLALVVVTAEAANLNPRTAPVPKASL